MKVLSNIAFGDTLPSNTVEVVARQGSGAFTVTNGERGERRALEIWVSTGTTPYAAIQGWNYASGQAMNLALQTSGGFVGIGTTIPLSKVHIVDTYGYRQLMLQTSYTPSGTNDANGQVGAICWDNNYIYVKTGIGWKRVALSTF